MSARPKKPHPEDLLLAAYIREAEHFSAFIFAGRENRKCIRGFTSYAAARARADELEAEHPGRRALVYALGPKGYSVPVTPALLELAEEGR